MKYFLLCFLSLPVFAAPWVSNKDHSEVLFKVPYMTVSELTGRFGDFEASADFEEKSKTFQAIQVTLVSASIDTSNKMRDGHLKGVDFFESEQYPQIKFVAQKIQKLNSQSFKASGILTIKNISKPMSVNFSVTDSVKDTWGYENKFVKFNGKINRRDFNIKWNKTLDEQKYLVGEDIELWGVLQMQPANSKTPPSKHMIPDTDYIREREEKLRKKEESESSFARKFRRLINGQ